ncbi:MAG: hypothetical protein K9N34_08040, partial [Candidatus Marinimicrobia bacterium]|nr:hypothetical protein [Candidatus Neomarinimicrobiota bacterium]
MTLITFACKLSTDFKTRAKNAKKQGDYSDMKPHLFSSIPLGVTILTGIMFFSTCQEPEKPEPYPNSDLVLEKLDVSCTESWLKISLTQMDSSTTDSIPIILTRDGEEVQSFAFTPPETLVVDDGLNPSHSYRYQAQRQSVHENKVIDSSNTLTVTTLDTTSHDFTWTIDTLGSYGSYLNDVAIIDENNIWAVGMIETDSGSYNAAHWDGERWALLRITAGGVFNPLNSVFAFKSDDIWFGKQSLPIHFDGYSFYKFTPAADGYPGGFIINAIWGSSPEDVWFVGSGGSIVHYDGGGFQRMQSGTEVDLKDIDGTSDGEYVFTRGYDETAPSQNIILEYDSEQWKTIYYIDGHYYPEPGDYGHIEGFGVFKETLYVATVAGLWKYNYLTQESVLIP